MKVQLSKIINTANSLQELASLAGWNGRLSLKISKVYDACVAESKTYMNIREKRLVELVERDEKGYPLTEELVVDGKTFQSYKLSATDRESFILFDLEVLNQEVDINEITIKESELEKVSNLRPTVLSDLNWLLVITEE